MDRGTLFEPCAPGIHRRAHGGRARGRTLCPYHGTGRRLVVPRADRSGRITVDGSIIEFPLPVTGAFPSAITAGDDGGMWFTLNQGNTVGRIDMDGAVTVHLLPTESAGPAGIAAGHDGTLWFTEIGAGQIDRITSDGRITEFPLPGRAAWPHAVTVDGRGTVWFTEEHLPNVGGWIDGL
ncbi:Vgb family protein [Streptomyces orinoci]